MEHLLSVLRGYADTSRVFQNAEIAEIKNHSGHYPTMSVVFNDSEVTEGLRKKAARQRLEEQIRRYLSTARMPHQLFDISVEKESVSFGFRMDEARRRLERASELRKLGVTENELSQLISRMASARNVGK